VYVIDENDMLRLVHDHAGGEYALTDVIEFFELGTAIEELAVDIVEFDRFELRELKSMANAYQKSYPDEFIAMCLEIHEAALAEDMLRLDQVVIADCVNPVAATRAAWRAVAQRTGMPIVEIEVVRAGIAPARADYEAWDRPPVVIDTTGRTVDQSVTEAVGAL